MVVLRCLRDTAKSFLPECLHIGTFRNDAESLKIYLDEFNGYCPAGVLRILSECVRLEKFFHLGSIQCPGENPEYGNFPTIVPRSAPAGTQFDKIPVAPG